MQIAKKKKKKKPVILQVPKSHFTVIISYVYYVCTMWPQKFALEMLSLVSSPPHPFSDSQNFSGHPYLSLRLPSPPIFLPTPLYQSIFEHSFRLCFVSKDGFKSPCNF